MTAKSKLIDCNDLQSYKTSKKFIKLDINTYISLEFR